MKSKSISPAARCILLLQGFLKKKCPVLRFYTPKHFQLFNLCLFFLAMEFNRECWNCYKAWLEQAKRKLLVLRLKKKRKILNAEVKHPHLTAPWGGHELAGWQFVEGLKGLRLGCDQQQVCMSPVEAARTCLRKNTNMHTCTHREKGGTVQGEFHEMCICVRKANISCSKSDWQPQKKNMQL